MARAPRSTARSRKATPPRPETILSSAAILTAKNNRRIAQPDRGWQAEAWDFYDAVGALAYVVAWIKGALAKATLYPVRYNSAGDPERVDDPQIVGILNTFGGGPQGQSSILGAFAPHLFVPGEGYAVGRDVLDDAGQPTGVTDWFVAGVEELTLSGGEWLYDRGDGMPERYREDETVVVRIWIPHPRKSWHADSTVRHVLSDLAEIVGYNQRVLAEINSRLASNGLLLLPNEISFAPAGPDSEPAPPGVEAITWQFTEVAKVAMSDRRSAAALVPIIGTMPADQIEKVQWIQFWSDFDDALADLRKDALARLAMGLNVPPEVMLGVGETNHWPCDEATEVFTRDHGWVTHDRLEVGTVVRALSHETGSAEWVALDGVRREQVTDHPMVRISTANLDALTTLDHRWPVIRNGERIWTDAASLRPSDQIVRGAPAMDLPTTAKYDDDFVSLVGWFITEGTCAWPGKRHAQVRIGQSHVANPDRVAELRALLTRLYGPASTDMRRPPGTPRGGYVSPKWREDREARGMTIFNLNKTAYAPILDAMTSWHTKVLSTDFVLDLTRGQLALLLEAAAVGDGILRPSGGLSINQRDEARLEPFALAATLLGRPFSYHREEKTDGFSPGIQTYLNVPVKGATVPAGETTPTAYTGVIFCPRVPVARSFLARRGEKVYYTGNSAWAVDESAIKMHIEPLLQVLCDGIKEGFFQPALAAENIDNPALYGVAFDASKLKARPNKSPEAMELYDRGLLKGERAVVEAGFVKDDMATDEDFARIERLDAARNTRPGAGNEPPVTVPETPPAPAGRNEPPMPAASIDQAAIEKEIALQVKRQTMLASADVMVLNALTVVGKRLLNAVNGLERPAGTSRRTSQVPPTAVYTQVSIKEGRERTVMADLWPTSGTVASRLGVDQVTLQTRLAQYVSGLVASKQTHSLSALTEALGDLLP